MRYLSFTDSELGLDVQPAAAHVVEQVLRFFCTHFVLSDLPSANEAAAKLRFAPWEQMPENCTVEKGQMVVLRESSAAQFNLSASRICVDGREIFISESTRTAMFFCPADKVVDFYVSSDSVIQIIEVIRDIIIKDQESKGTLVLHACAAIVEGVCVVGVGEKGRGKSTLLLDLLANSSGRLLTGDKLFIRPSGLGGGVHGWPDYPHLGLGTLRRHPSLLELVRNCGLDSENDDSNTKYLLDPTLFAEALGASFARNAQRIDVVVFPNIAVKGEGRICRLHGDQWRQEVLDNLIFSGNYEQTKWHSFITPSYDKTPASVRDLTEYLSLVPAYALESAVAPKTLIEAIASKC